MTTILTLSVLLILSLVIIPPTFAEPDKFMEDNYIIKFKDGVKPNMNHDWNVKHKYSKIFNGLSVEIKNPNTMKKLLEDDTIESITPVEIFTIPEPLFADINTIPPDIGENQYIKPGTTRHGFDKNPSVNAGDGITNVPLVVAIVDTGCTLEHPDLNYIFCLDFTGSAEGVDDLSGHGTHTAGSVAAINNGFGVVGGAPGAGIIGLKVCGSGGSNSCANSAILAAWDWLAINGKANNILVNNNSWGGSSGAPVEDGNCGFNDGDLMHQALCKMTDAGIVTVMSAGNSNADGVNFVGCGYDEAICVSAMDDTDGLPGGLGPNSTCRTSSDDTIAGFSNYGSVVDISADGVCEPSTVPDCSKGESICSPTGYLEISGTSMSSPQATGGVALAIVHLYGFDGASNRDEVLAVNNFVKATGFPINGPDGFSCNKPTGCSEPLLNVETYVFEGRQPSHDVGVTSLSVPQKSGIGFEEEISYSIVNLGTFDETVTTELRIDDVLVKSDTVTLSELRNEKFTFNWIPSILGTTVISLEIIDPPVGDTNADNNQSSISIEVVERIRDVAVFGSISKPDNLVAGVGCENCIRSTVKNNGNFPELVHTVVTHLDSGTVLSDRTTTIPVGITYIIDIPKGIIIDGVNEFKSVVDLLPGESNIDNNISLFNGTASEENRHYDVESVAFFADRNTWVEDESGRLRLWMNNAGTETIDNPKLSFGLFEDGSFLRGERTINTLEHGDGSIVNFIIAPFEFSVGQHTIVGTGDYLNEYDERDETNNSKTLTITILPASPPPAPIHDVAVESVTVNDIEVGDVLMIDTVYLNEGNQDELDITLVMKVDGEIISSAKKTLLIGESKLLGSSFGSINLTAGIHTATVELLVPIDDDPSDNIKSVNFNVIDPTPPDRDGDGVPDNEDNCPDEPGPPSNGGCPIISPPEDITPPTVNITSPSYGDQIPRKSTVRVDASDNIQVSYVQIFVDNKLEGQDNTFPYSIQVSLKGKPGLDHEIKATACDTSGNCSSHTIQVFLK